jgi:hypothetical protein
MNEASMEDSWGKLRTYDTLKCIFMYFKLPLIKSIKSVLPQKKKFMYDSQSVIIIFSYLDQKKV